MPQINQLSRVSQVVSGDVLPVFQQSSGDTRGISVGQLSTSLSSLVAGGLQRQILPFSSKAQFNASLPLLADGQYSIDKDESITPPQGSRYQVTGGVAALVYKSSDGSADPNLRTDLGNAASGTSLLKVAGSNVSLTDFLKIGPKSQQFPDQMAAVTTLKTGAAIQAAHDAIAAVGGGTLFIPKDTYVWSSGFNWSQRKVRVIAEEGTIWDFSGASFIGSGSQYAVRYTDANYAFSGGWGNMHGVTLLGPPASSGKDGVYLHATTPVDNAGGANIHYSGCVIIGFRRQTVWGDNACFTRFSQCQFATLAGANFQTETAIYVLSGINSGEEQTFVDCHFASPGTIVENSVTGYTGGFVFIGCGIDYFKQVVLAPKPIRIKFKACHIESYSFGSIWFDIDVPGNVVEIEGGEIWLTAQCTNYLFRAINSGGGSNGGGGIFLSRVFWQVPFGFTVDYLADPASTLPIIEENRQFYSGQVFPPLSPTASIAPYTTDQATFSRIVTQSDGADASVSAQDTVNQHRGKNTWKFTTSATGQEIKRRITVPAFKAIKGVSAGVFIKASGFAASSWSVTLLGMDANGNIITTYTAYNGSTIAAFSQRQWWLQARERGVRSFVLDIYANPQAAGETGGRTFSISEFVVCEP